MRPLVALLVLAAAALQGGAARAHGGATPPVAWPIKPEIVGEVADRSYVVSWRDSDRPSITSTVTFDIHFTSAMPPTWPIGVIPMGLTGDYVAVAVPEADRANQYTWDTSRVPAGSYFVWTMANEDPPDTSQMYRVIAFSRGVVTVAHPGDPVHPSVIVPIPDGPFTEARGEGFEIAYEAFDPDRTGRVRLRARRRGEAAMIPIADGLPADAQGRHVWLLAGVPEGGYALEATITDARGLSFTAWSRFFLEVVRDTPDAGAGGDAGAPPPDAGTSASLDAGAAAADAGASPPAGSKGCGCAAASGGAGAPDAIFAILLAFGAAFRNPDRASGIRTITGRSRRGASKRAGTEAALGPRR